MVGAIGVNVIDYIDGDQYTSAYPKKNTIYKKGDVLGRFSIGGSTVILVFETGTVTWNSQIVENSSKQYESYVYVKETSLGVLK